MLAEEAMLYRERGSSIATVSSVFASEGVDTVRGVATREDLHRRVDALSEAQVERARIVIVDEVDRETSVDAILARHGEQRLSAEELQGHFGDLPGDGEG